MMTLIDPIALWLADFYLAATILLAAATAVLAVVKQPARRMTVAWGTLLGLLVAAIVCQSASRPRLDLGPILSNHDNRVVEVHTTKTSLPATPNVTETAPPRADEPQHVRSERFEPQTTPVAQSAEIVSPPSASVAQAPSPIAWGRLVLVGVVWSFLTGCLLMATWLSVGVWRASRLVRQSAPAREAWLDELRAIVGPAGRPPQLRVNRRLSMPVATGAFQPTILLPAEFARSGRPQELRAVLVHEWAHIKNGDLWLLALDRVLLAVLWPHPLYWWTRRRLRADQEFLADAAAARQTGAAEYAALLVEWARKVAGRRHLTVSTAVGIWERPASLAPRITALLDDSDATILRTSGRTRIGVATAMTVCALFACLFSLRPARTELANAQDQATNEHPRDAKIQPQKAASSKPTKLDKPLSSGVAVTPKIVDYHLEKDAVGGLCLDRDEVRVGGVEVALYIIGLRDNNHEFVSRTITNDEGQFVFRPVPNLKSREELYLFVARKKGRGTSEGTLRQRHDWIDLRVGAGVSMNGVVRDEQGKPIAGALVRGHSYWSYSVPDESPSVRTNERGEFQIDGLPRFGACSVSHPDYLSAGFGDAKKNPVVATLQKASVVQGQVVDGETGQPVAGAVISLQRLGHVGEEFAPRGGKHGRPPVTTDSKGRYQVRSLRPGTFNLSFRGGPAGVASAIIETLKVGRGQTVEVPPVRLAKGAIVAVRLIDNDAGRLVDMEANETVVIGIRSGEASASADAKLRLEALHMRHDGTIGVWVPAGKHTISLSGGPYFSIGDVQEGVGHDLREVEIKGGEAPTVEFRVVRITPSRVRGGSRVLPGA